MVGVPRSRGCVGCRQQKKKCEVILEPPCSRCKRLQIPCAGYGERRLKFQDESQNYVVGRGRKKTSATASSPSTSPQSTNLSQNECHDQDRVVIISNPTNILTTLIASFSHSIDANDQDTRHNLAWNFGGFLYDVPQCLGSNESLDSAADALVAGYIHFRRDRHSKADEVCLQKYSRALRSLRKCLSTEEKACEPATLCAIMIIMVVETLMGVSSEGSLQHAVGAARILKCRGTKPPKNELERKLLMALRGPVVVQAFYLDESYYTPTEWDRLVSGYSSPDDIDEEGFFNDLAVSCRLFQKTRGALSRESVSQQEIDQLISHVSDLHKSLTERLLNLSGTLDRTRDFSGSERNIEARLEKFKHGHGVREYGLTLSTQIVVNCILGALQGMWHESTERENAWLCREICSLGERDATYHQPLGSAWVLLTLPVAYIGAYSAEDKERVLKLLASYTKDLSSDATQSQTAGLESLFAYLSCSDLPQRTKSATEIAM